jgi:hypothetical protein
MRGTILDGPKMPFSGEVVISQTRKSGVSLEVRDSAKK